MTWNLLTDTALDAPPWEVRCPRAAARVAALAPTVLGTQEGSVAMLDALVSALPDAYRWVGEGRRGRLTDETCAIVYDSTALTVLDVRHRWLSATPELPASMAADAHLPRMLTAVRFHDATSDVCVTVVNTHLDHLGPQARALGSALVADEGRGGGAAVVLGDFNDVAGASEAYDTLVRAGLHDALAPRHQPPQRRRTFIGRHEQTELAEGMHEEGDQIDWLFVTPQVTVRNAWVDVEIASTPMASDHRPVVADITLG
jgi:endonuclease/exonuclease/phosphatase family metal-dependent hydrolase